MRPMAMPKRTSSRGFMELGVRVRREIPAIARPTARASAKKRSMPARSRGKRRSQSASSSPGSLVRSSSVDSLR